MKKIFTIFTIIFFSSQSFAQEAEKKAVAEKLVEEVCHKIAAIAKEKNLPDNKRIAKIISVIDEAIDHEWIAKFVLGKNYKTASDEQKETFKKLYRDFMINTYAPKFKRYNVRVFDVKEVSLQGSFYLAKAEFIAYDSETPVSVDFRVKERDKKMVIVDFIAEGISLIETQRSEFNSAIAKNGIEKFLEDLDVKTKKLKAENK
jgi:phospholipid transport system substrate-binding protein